MPSSVAPRISGWQRRVGGMPGPYSAASASGVASGGTGANGLMVELLVDGSWSDITARVMVRDNSGQISIRRGQSSEGQNPDPGSCGLQLNNRDGLFSTGNPMSPWWGKIGRNTQIRVSVAKGDDKSYRFWGAVPSWPEDWDTTGTDVWIDVAAVGILNLLGQGTSALRSTMYRGLMNATLTTPPVEYWACEDGASSTSLASAIGGRPMRLVGSPTLASDTGFLCSAALPVMNGGSLVGTIPTYTVTGQSQVRFLMWLPTAPPDHTQLVKVAATGSVPFWAVYYGAGGGLGIRGLDADGLTVLFDSAPGGFNADGRRLRISVELTQVGANVSWDLSVIDADTGTIGGTSGTFNTVTVGRLTKLTVTPGQTITTGVFGHISVQSDVTSVFDLTGPTTAFVDESPSTRLGRLSSEQGVSYTDLGVPSPDAMGPQLPSTFLALVQECVDVDGGVLFERETAYGIAMRSRSALYNQTPRLTLSYPGNQLADIPKPVPDSQTIRNSITASRPTGSSATAVQEDGPLSVQDPPLGVGAIPDTPTLNVASDDDLAPRAAWRLHIGTVNEPRYPAISINLAHPSMAAQRLAALNVLFGNRIVVTDPPHRIGGDISQIVIGIQETITHFEHRITYVCEPESPYRVAVLNDPILGRLDTAGAQLAGDMTPTSTTVLVATTVGALWTTDPAQFPIGVTVGGEQMTATNITGATSPQTFTVTRSVNSVVKTHQVGEAVSLTQPMILAL